MLWFDDHHNLYMLLIEPITGNGISVVKVSSESREYLKFMISDF